MTLPYLTEERLRVLGFVGDLEGFSSAQIRSLILGASAKVDAFCNAPKLPQPYSFRGGTVIDDTYDWNPGDTLTPSQRRFFLRQTPIKSIESLRIYVTLNQYTDFLADELIINNILGSVEIISLALTSSAPLGAFVLPNIGLQTPQAKFSYTYGHQFTAVDEILEPTDASQYRAGNQFWDSSTVTVKVDGVVQASGWTADRTEGTITFDTALAADALVTASYGYTLPTDIAMGTGWIVQDMLTEKGLLEKGMGNVRSLRVGEIAIDRGRDLVDAKNPSAIKIPAEAEGHLIPWRFITVR